MADNIEKKLGIIEVNALRDANGLMEGNTHLKSVECPFPALTNGSNMFKDCINLTLFYCDDLSKLYNGTSMFGGCEKLRTVVGSGGNPLNLSSLSNGTSMFYYTSISEFTTDLPSLTDGTSMFLNSGLTIFDSSLPIISTYNDMFAGCPLSTFKCKELGIYSSGKDFMTTSKLEDANYTLISFNANMPYVTNANNMFLESPLETFKSNNLSKLTTATSMFECNLFNGLTTFDCYELPLLDNGSRMFYNTQLSSFNTSLPKLTNGSQMFYNTQLSSFDVELPYLSIADGMFSDCDSLKSFTSDLPKLSTYSGIFMGLRLNTFDGGDIGVTDTGLDFITNSYLKESKDTLTSFKGNLTKSTNTDEMFVGFNKLDTFEGDMNNVTSSKKMFKDCEQLQTFKSNYLENLSDATEMFYNCYNLLEFDSPSPLPSLSNGNNMFYYTNISEFTADLPSLTDGSGMFCECDNLKTFNSMLESLTTYTNMFMNAKLNTFRGGVINISDTGSSFMTGSCLWDSKDTLTTFYCHLPAMTNADLMFKDFTLLNYAWGDFNNVTSANKMFYNCKKLKTCPINFSSLKSAVSMFEYSSIDKIPCKFPKLTEATYMFCECGIEGHLDVNCPNLFENLTENVVYMFGYLPNLTSINFDVSSLSNGVQMFGHCPNLTTCTGAKFKEGGSYQSMFTESNFTEESVITIFEEAIAASVQSLHIGMNGLPSDSLKNRYGLVQLDYGSNHLWCRGELPYCVCHQTPGFICDTVQAEIAKGNTSNLVEGDKDTSVVIVCHDIPEGS